MEEAKQILTASKKLLEDMKHGTKSTLADPTVISWLAADKDKLPEICRAFGSQHDILAPFRDLKKLAATINDRVAVLENDVGSLTAELSITISRPEKLLRESQAAEEKCRNLAQQHMQPFLRHRDALLTTDQAIRQNLNLESMLKVAELFCPNKSTFASGAKVILLAVEDKSLPKAEKRLTDLQLLAANIGRRLQQMEFPEDLPQIAQAALRHITQAIQKSVDLVKDYTDSVAKNMSDHLLIIAQIQSRFGSLATLAPSDMLLAIRQEATVLAQEVCAAEKYASVINGASLAAKVLDDARMLNLAFQGSLTKEFAFSINSQQGQLSTAVFAARQAQTFFDGAPGWSRMAKLMFRSLFGHKVVTETSLGALLANLLHQASLTANNDPANNEQFLSLLAEVLEPYSSPFPAKDMGKFLVNALQAYAVLLENHLADLAIASDAPPSPGDAGEAAEPASQPLGKLIARMEIRAENLQESL